MNSHYPPLHPTLLTDMDIIPKAENRFGLRRQAEELLQEKMMQSPEQLNTLSSEAQRELFHNLYVHQIELELQNEELRQAQLELNAAKAHFFDLYDLAPVGYLTVRKDGLINQANLAAATLLGLPRRALINKQLSFFIVNNDLDHYHSFHNQIFESNRSQTLDLRMLNNDGIQFWAHLEADTAQDAGGVNSLRIIITNITVLIKTEMALRESVTRAESLIDSALDGVISVDQHNRIICWNQQAMYIFGYSLKQALGRDVAELIVPPAYREAYRQDMAQFIKTGISRIVNTRTEVVAMRSDDSEFPMELSISAVEQQEGYFFNAYVRDITDRKQAENALRIAATVFEAQEGIIITDANSAILRTNQAVSNITGYTEKELIGKNPRILSSGRHGADFYAAMWKNINEICLWEGEIWNRRKSGEIYPEHLTISSVKDSSGRVANYVATLTDITMSQAAADKIKYLAFYDPLTCLPNRLLFRDRLILAFASSQRNDHYGALLFIDMDNFKNLNDTLGHGMGDLLLQQVAKRLKACVREGDTIARLGGDEFVVVLEDLSKSINEAAIQVEAVGNKILVAFSQPYHLSTHNYNNTASIGIALFKGQQQAIDELLKQADIAMYSAKASGRNTLRFFDQHMQDSIANRVGLERDLKLALAKNQLILYYQPQVEANQQIIGAEALIRWHHPQRGLVSPVDFIPLAEHVGFIIELGDWVAHAC